MNKKQFITHLTAIAVSATTASLITVAASTETDNDGECHCLLPGCAIAPFAGFLLANVLHSFTLLLITACRPLPTDESVNLLLTTQPSSICRTLARDCGHWLGTTVICCLIIALIDQYQDDDKQCHCLLPQCWAQPFAPILIGNLIQGALTTISYTVELYCQHATTTNSQTIELAHTQSAAPL